MQPFGLPGCRGDQETIQVEMEEVMEDRGEVERGD